ncbi:MAG: TatD family hydrolase [Nanoarchaeota archaeon]
MIVDVHCHLTDPYFKDKLDMVISNARKNDVIFAIANGINYEDNKKVLELSKKYEIVKAAFGFYPDEIIKSNEEEINLTLEQIKKNKNKIIAIGEIGLDLYHNEEIKKQKEVFVKIIELAEKINKPLIIHSRKAEQECIELLKEFKFKKALFHSFTGNFKLVKEIEKNNWMLSIPCNIIRSEHFQNIIKDFNLNQILTETDSPYLSPYKNKMNEPSFIVETIKMISELKNLEKEEVEKIIFKNFQNFF